jgi:hypothetical protein
MSEFDNDNSIKRLLKAAYRPVAPSSEFKEQLRERLTHEVCSTDAGMSQPLLARPRLVIPIIVAIAAGLIGYGSWLSLNLVPNLLP